jgi:hypothetical protein
MIRVFGSTTCGKCVSLVNGLKLLQMPFEYVDAFADDTQDFCDEHNVDGLPHVQLITDGKVSWERAKTVSLNDIVLAVKTSVDQ